MLKEKELREKLKELEEEKQKYELEHESLNFAYEMAQADQGQTFLEVLKYKMEILHNIKKKIDRYSTREQIIIKVLDQINKTENQSMFQQEDKEILDKYDDVRKEWEIKRQLNEKYKKMKDNFNDFQYYEDYAPF